MAFKSMEYRPKKDKPDYHSEKGKNCATCSPLDIQETALVANHLVLSKWGIAGRRERESCKTGLQLSLSSLLKL